MFTNFLNMFSLSQQVEDFFIKDATEQLKILEGADWSFIEKLYTQNPNNRTKFLDLLAKNPQLFTQEKKLGSTCPENNESLKVFISLYNNQTIAEHIKANKKLAGDVSKKAQSLISKDLTLAFNVFENGKFFDDFLYQYNYPISIDTLFPVPIEQFASEPPSVRVARTRLVQSVTFSETPEYPWLVKASADAETFELFIRKKVYFEEALKQQDLLIKKFTETTYYTAMAKQVTKGEIKEALNLIDTELALKLFMHSTNDSTNGCHFLLFDRPDLEKCVATYDSDAKLGLLAKIADSVNNCRLQKTEIPGILDTVTVLAEPVPSNLKVILSILKNYTIHTMVINGPSKRNQEHLEQFKNILTKWPFSKEELILILKLMKLEYLDQEEMITAYNALIEQLISQELFVKHSSFEVYAKHYISSLVKSKQNEQAIAFIEKIPSAHSAKKDALLEYFYDAFFSAPVEANSLQGLIVNQSESSKIICKNALKKAFNGWVNNMSQSYANLWKLHTDLPDNISPYTDAELALEIVKHLVKAGKFAEVSAFYQSVSESARATVIQATHSTYIRELIEQKQPFVVSNWNTKNGGGNFINPNVLDDCYLALLMEKEGIVPVTQYMLNGNNMTYLLPEEKAISLFKYFCRHLAECCKKGPDAANFDDLLKLITANYPQDAPYKLHFYLLIHQLYILYNKLEDAFVYFQDILFDSSINDENIKDQARIILTEMLVNGSLHLKNIASADNESALHRAAQALPYICGAGKNPDAVKLKQQVFATILGKKQLGEMEKVNTDIDHLFKHMSVEIVELLQLYHADNSFTSATVAQLLFQHKMPSLIEASKEMHEKMKTMEANMQAMAKNMEAMEEKMKSTQSNTEHKKEVTESTSPLTPRFYK